VGTRLNPAGLAGSIWALEVGSLFGYAILEAALLVAEKGFSRVERELPYCFYQEISRACHLCHFHPFRPPSSYRVRSNNRNIKVLGGLLGRK
jgi:hypothetical protein